MTASPDHLGTITSIWRFPVKSMAGESLDTVEISWNGLAGDRRWSFLQPDSSDKGFPYQTIRENSSMWRYRPEFLEPERPWRSPVLVHTPDARALPVTDPALAEEIGPGCQASKLDRGQFDSMPLSLITTATVRALCERAGVEPNPLRFRPNLLVESASGEPFAEDEWLGRDLAIGDVVVRMDRRDPRCVIINVDPGTEIKTPAVLKGIGPDRKACAGVYGSTVRPGLVQVGQAISG